MKKLIKAIYTFVRSLWSRNKTASDAFLSESLRCSECGKEIRGGNGFFIARWYCNECLGCDDGFQK